MDSPGLRIRAKRKELNLSQTQLARLVGISQSSLCELELGDSKMPSAQVLHDLARELHISPMWIMTGHDGAVETLSKEEEQIIQRMRGLNAEQKLAVYAVIKTMEGKKDG